jgi:hypothetical protein
MRRPRTAVVEIRTAVTAGGSPAPLCVDRRMNPLSQPLRGSIKGTRSARVYVTHDKSRRHGVRQKNVTNLVPATGLDNLIWIRGSWREEEPATAGRNSGGRGRGRRRGRDQHRPPHGRGRRLRATYRFATAGLPMWTPGRPNRRHQYRRLRHVWGFALASGRRRPQHWCEARRTHSADDHRTAWVRRAVGAQRRTGRGLALRYPRRARRCRARAVRRWTLRHGLGRPDGLVLVRARASHPGGGRAPCPRSARSDAVG